MAGTEPSAMRTESLRRRFRWPLALAMLLACATAARASVPDVLHIDPVQSYAGFSVRLIWWQSVVGQFNDVRGQVRIDPDRRTARVHASIRVDSVLVKPSRFRERLLGKHFFDVGTYPDILFVSDPMPLSLLESSHEHLKGTLTLHGVTRPMTLQLYGAHCPAPHLADCTLRLRGWLDRTRFDMRAYRALVSSRVHLDLVIHLQAEPEPSPASSAPARASSS